MMPEAAMRSPTQRTRQTADMVRRLSHEELTQLVNLVPMLRRFLVRRREPTIDKAELKAYLLQEMAQLGDEYRPMRDGDPFLGGLTVGEYFSLSDRERAETWEDIHSMAIDDFEERDVKPEAVLPRLVQPGEALIALS